MANTLCAISLVNVFRFFLLCSNVPNVYFNSISENVYAFSPFVKVSYVFVAIKHIYGAQLNPSL